MGKGDWRRWRVAAAAGVSAVALIGALTSSASGQNDPRGGRGGSAQRIIGKEEPKKKRTFRFYPVDHREIDGSHNNERNTEMGAEGVQLGRLARVGYGDGISSPSDHTLASARAISNIVLDQPDGVSIPNPFGASDYIWQWGQFLDHDIDLTDGVTEPYDILVPNDDRHFPAGSYIGLNRAIYDPETGDSYENPRQQINEITAWIDASNVYGSTEERAAALRTFEHGKLKTRYTKRGELLPLNTEGLANAVGPRPDPENLVLAGDVRANEQIGLTVMHTLWVREHNRIAHDLRLKHPYLSDEELYQAARAIVGAEMQAITYEEFLPALLGPNPLPPYTGYKRRVDGGILNEFSVAAYRFGHSSLSPTLLRRNRKGEPIRRGDLPLAQAFFRPELVNEGGIEPILRGLAMQRHQKIDAKVVDGLRNFLFGPPGAGGFDLASLNIQRGRDHGVPSYNDVREDLGLPRAQSFADITSDSSVQDALALAYDNDVDQVDLWVGGLAEDPRGRSQLGHTFTRILKIQFRRLRDGDRYWYENTFDERDADAIRKTRLADVIRRNTDIGDEIPDNVFYVDGKIAYDRDGRYR